MTDATMSPKMVDELHKPMKFIEIVAEYLTICPYPGYKDKPYFSIRYEENGELFEGFGTYKPEVLSEYIREYFMGADVVERKKGKWIITDTYNNQIWHCDCSECGEDPLHFISGSEDWWLNKLPKFCPYCGADMREEKTDDPR